MPRTLRLLFYASIINSLFQFVHFMNGKSFSREKSLHPPEAPPFFNSEASHSCIFVLSVLVTGRRCGPSNWVSAKAKSESPRVHVLWQASQYPFLTSLCKAMGPAHIHLWWVRSSLKGGEVVKNLSINKLSAWIEGEIPNFSVRERHFFPILQVCAMNIPCILFHKRTQQSQIISITFVFSCHLDQV